MCQLAQFLINLKAEAASHETESYESPEPWEPCAAIRNMRVSIADNGSIATRAHAGAELFGRPSGCTSSREVAPYRTSNSMLAIRLAFN